MRQAPRPFIHVVLAGGIVALGYSGELAGQARVVIKEGKTESTEGLIDPVPRIEPRFSAGMYFGLTLEGTRITCTPETSIFARIRIDNQEYQPGFDPMTGEQARAEPLPPGRHGKKRLGTQTKWKLNNIFLTQNVELAPSRLSGPAKLGQKRRLDVVRVSYLLENKDSRDHLVEFRTFIDTLIKENDGALFAAPTTKPGEILDGVELKDRTLPEYLQVLEKPNVKDPGFTATLTLKFSGKAEGPTRVVLSNTGVFNLGGWEAVAQKANGDSACFLYWGPKNLKPGGQRQLVWAYGGGVSDSPENEGAVALNLGGSLEPGKLFTILATIDDPSPTQTLTLELPPGMERMEGKLLQAVPTPSDTGRSAVLWKARVERPGSYSLKVHSSTGTTQVKNILIEYPK